MAAALPSVVLVTGASRGIGRAAAKKLAARGMRVALNYHRNEAAAREALASLPGSGHAIFPADVSDPAACDALVDAAQKHFGRLDVLVNNAGLYEDNNVKTSTFTEWQTSWRRVIDANLTGPANLSFLAAQHMLRSGGGRMVNITSRAAFRGELTASAYAASKAGLNIFGQSLAKTLAADKIYVYTIAPGWVDTDMAKDSLAGPNRAEVLSQHPLGRVATPEEVADAIAWLALDAPAAMTGAILDLNGASYLRT